MGHVLGTSRIRSPLDGRRDDRGGISPLGTTDQMSPHRAAVPILDAIALRVEASRWQEQPFLSVRVAQSVGGD